MDTPVLADLWERLGTLDALCEMKPENIKVDDGSGEKALWWVVVRRRTDPDDAFKVVDSTLGQALSLAVLVAEQRGWRR